MPMSVAQVMETVAARYGLAVADLKGPRRLRRMARPRQLAMYLARETTEKSLPQIGRAFHRHHTTVLEATRRIPELMAGNPVIAAEVQTVRQMLGEG